MKHLYIKIHLNIKNLKGQLNRVGVIRTRYLSFPKGVTHQFVFYPLNFCDILYLSLSHTRLILFIEILLVLFFFNLAFSMFCNYIKINNEHNVCHKHIKPNI